MRAELTLYFPATNQSYDVNAGSTIIAGSSDTCNINLHRYLRGNLKLISRRHFRITDLPDEGYALFDLGSLNGTSVNDRLLRPGSPCFLRGGDVIILARNEDFEIEVSMLGEAWTEEFASIRLPSSGRMTGLVYDAAYDQFLVDGERIQHTYFSKIEHDTLRYLSSQPGKVRSYDDLAENVWDGWVQTNTIAKTVGNLRRKLNSVSAGSGSYIQTIRGRGFRCRIGGR